jgi:hypothetical protein
MALQQTELERETTSVVRVQEAGWLFVVVVTPRLSDAAKILLCLHIDLHVVRAEPQLHPTVPRVCHTDVQLRTISCFHTSPSTEKHPPIIYNTKAYPKVSGLS